MSVETALEVLSSSSINSTASDSCSWSSCDSSWSIYGAGDNAFSTTSKTSLASFSLASAVIVYGLGDKGLSTTAGGQLHRCAICFPVKLVLISRDSSSRTRIGVFSWAVNVLR